MFWGGGAENSGYHGEGEGVEDCDGGDDQGGAVAGAGFEVFGRGERSSTGKEDQEEH